MAKKLVKKSSKKSAAKKSTAVHPLLRDIWPQERDVLWRPERLRYVRKIIHNKGCVFCASRDAGVDSQSLCVFKNDLAMVVLNKYPYNSGHAMVLPTRHCGDLLELSANEHAAIQKLILKTVKVIKKEYEVSGFNIGLNMGAVAGAGLPDHLHWHVIPRWNGDTNFFPLIAETKVISQSLDDIFARYSRRFQEGVE